MVKHLTLTLTGVVQTLSDAYAAVAGVTADQAGAADIACQAIILQADAGNANLVFIGGAGDGTLTTSVFGFQLAIPVTNIPSVPLVLPAYNGPLRASDIKVLGTNAQKLHALLIGA